MSLCSPPRRVHALKVNGQTISQYQLFKTDICARLGVDSPIKQTNWTGRRVSSPKPVWRTVSSLFVSVFGELWGRESGCTFYVSSSFCVERYEVWEGQLRVRWCQKHYLEWADSSRQNRKGNSRCWDLQHAMKVTSSLGPLLSQTQLPV